MDPTKMLHDLLEQRRLIDATIETVERLVATAKRKGRLPKAVTEARDILDMQTTHRNERGNRHESQAASAAVAS